MKKKLLLFCATLVLAFALPVTAFAAGEYSFGVGASTGTVKAGESFYVSTNGNCTGGFNVSASNGASVSQSNVWVYNGGLEVGSILVSVPSNATGSVTVYFDSYDVTAPDYTLVNVHRSVTVGVESAPAPDPTPTPTPSTPSNPSTPSTGGSGSSAATTAPETEAEADKAETEEPKEEPKEEAKEEVKTEEVVVAEQEGEEDTDCNWHWIILIAALLATVLAAILKQKALKWAMVALYAVVAVICVVLGGCSLCWIIAIVGLIVTCIFPIIAMLKKAESE